MKDSLLRRVDGFLHLHLKEDAPVLLGYSGGPDSKALLHLLLSCRLRRNFELHLAHVDHGWRESSRAEAEALCREAADLNLPLHLHTLSQNAFREGNLEEQARDYRIQFFRDLYHAHGCQGLFLAHQADDQAEVVLKRVCEGAHLLRLGGLKEISILEGMQVWRPLLSVRKKELLAWLQNRGLSFFMDPTNESPQFLRGRMRTDLMPLLAQGFGKEIISNFCYLGIQAESLKSYFLKKISPYLDRIVFSGAGSYLDISFGIEELEWQFLLKEWLAREGVFVSREVLHQFVRKVVLGAPARFPVRDGNIVVDKNRISIIKDKK